MVRIAIDWRSPTTWGSGADKAARDKCGIAFVHSDLGQRNERRAVRFANGRDVAGSTGCDGRPAFDHRHLRHGGVLREQAVKGVGNPRSPWGTTEGSVAERFGTSFQAARVRICSWFATGTSGEPSPGIHRLSGHTPRSGGIGGSGWGNGVAGIGGHVDAGAKSAIGRSRDVAERRVRGRYRDLGGSMTSWLHDLHYAIRQLRKSKGFTITAVLTLALAIGANAVVFSVLNGLILRPLSVPDGQSLYSIQRSDDKELGQSYPDFVDLRERNHSFEDVTGYGIVQEALDTGDKPSLLWGVEASGNYFDALHIQPYLGRFFHTSDEHGVNSAPYIVLSYSYWHSHFHDDRSVVGRVVQLNKYPFTVVGVAPPEFRGTLVFFSPQFFVPLVQQEQANGWSGLDNRSERSLLVIMGHLKPGVTPAQATAELNSIGAYLEKTYPKEHAKVSYSLGTPNLLGDQFDRPFQAFLAGLLLLTALILLAACANLGSLFAARTADRSREIAVRLALGSTRRHILRGLFAESVLISLFGGFVGLWASIALLRWLSDWQPFGNFPMHAPV